MEGVVGLFELGAGCDAVGLRAVFALVASDVVGENFNLFFPTIALMIFVEC